MTRTENLTTKPINGIASIDDLRRFWLDVIGDQRVEASERRRAARLLVGSLESAVLEGMVALWLESNPSQQSLSAPARKNPRRKVTKPVRRSTRNAKIP